MRTETPQKLPEVDGAQTGEARNPRLMGYVGFVAALSLIGTGLVLTRSSPPSLATVLLWGALFLIADAMWCRTPGGRGTVSMASALHLAAIPILSQSEVILVAWISRFLVNLVIQHKSWFRSFFNSAQLSIAVLMASLVYGATGGPSLSAPLDFPLLGMAVSFSIGAASYYVVNTGFVCGFLAILNRERIWSVWRANFGYRSGLTNSLALLMLAPAVVLAYEALGILGLVVFFIPMWLIRINWRDNVNLEQTHRGLIDSARFAAQGEMAVNVGKELNNYVSCMAANLRAMVDDGDRMEAKDRKARLEALAGQIGNMSLLGQGLMDFSHLESQFQKVDVFALVRGTVEFVRWQEQFDDLNIEADLDPRGGEITADPRQLQQLVMTLLLEVARLLQVGNSRDRTIHVSLYWTRPDEELVLIVGGTGGGSSKESQGQESAGEQPGTEASTSEVLELIQDHGGKVLVRSTESRGRIFEIRLPAHPPGLFEQKTERKPKKPPRVA